MAPSLVGYVLYITISVTQFDVAVRRQNHVSFFVFCDVQLQQNTLHYKRATSDRLRADMQSACSDEIVAVKLIFIDLPAIELHSGHIMGQVCIASADNVGLLIC